MNGTVPKPKPDHLGVAGPPIGPTVYLIVRHDGKMCDVKPNWMAAYQRIKDFHQCDDYSIEKVRIGEIPLYDYN